MAHSSFSKGRLFLSRVLFTPEVAWRELDPADRAALVARLQAAGPEGAAAADHLDRRRVRIGFCPQEASGAGWTLRGNLVLLPGARLDSPFTLAQLLHETLHLRQPLAVRLSVYGELLAWQADYRFYFGQTGRHYGEPGAPFHDPVARLNAGRFAELDGLSAASRVDLARARDLMRQIAPGYRAHRIPLQPLWGLVRYP